MKRINEGVLASIIILISAVMLLVTVLVVTGRRNTDNEDIPGDVSLNTAQPTEEPVGEIPTPDTQPVGGEPTVAPPESATPAPTAVPTTAGLPSDYEILSDSELSALNVNEAGDIPIIMWHVFVEADDPSFTDETRKYSNSFAYLEDLLQRLYDKGFRMISMNDFLNNNITVAAGYRPIVFTFDDGTAGQFNLTEVDGELKANPKSAVGVMEKFYESHPDFGLEGTFYINIGSGNATFEGKGTLSQRLQYLIDKGFEIGNHTYSHVYLPSVTDADTVIKELGKNQKEMLNLIPDYKFTSMALPFGSTTQDLFDHVISGTYEGVDYYNYGIMEVGWDPSVPPTSKNFKATSIHRIRSTGFLAEDCDLEYWLVNASAKRFYVSDGNPYYLTVPENHEQYVDTTKLKYGQQLKTY